MKSKAAMTTELILPSANCTMIVPHYSYDTNASGGTFNFERSKIERKQGNLDLLENTISQVMKTKYE